MQDEYDIDVEALPDDAVAETAPEPAPNSLNSLEKV
jgi:hypothetical protein